jgi:hypothetical protein
VEPRSSPPSSVEPSEPLDPGMQAFLESALPKDIPLPERTPFDDDPAARAQYLAAYRDGFATGVTSMIVTRCFIQSPALAQGYDDGTQAGRRLNRLRSESEFKRQFSSLHAESVITATAPEPERRIREEFDALSQRFLEELQSSYPRTLAIHRKEVQRPVYAYANDDYSGSNTGEFVRRRCYAAELAFDVDASAQRATIGTRDRELLGTYHLKFEYVDGRWTMLQRDDLAHVREVNRSPDGRSYQLEPVRSALADQLLNAAFDRASRSLHPS